MRVYHYYIQIDAYLSTIGSGSTGKGGIPGHGAPLPGFNTGVCLRLINVLFICGTVYFLQLREKYVTKLNNPAL